MQTGIPERREFKYLLPAERLPALRTALAGIAKPDPFAGTDGTYLIRSLYLDSPSFALYRANGREAPERFKLRIRTYPEASSSPVFLEVKRRTIDVIRKTRVKLPFSAWRDAIRPAARAVSRDHERVLALVHTHALEPKLLVDYRREAWMSTVDTYARVSVDTAIRCQPCDRWRLHAGPRRWRALDTAVQTRTPGSGVVLELKWADQAPAWMVDLVGRLGLVRRSFSKYAYGVEAQWLSPVGMTAGGASWT